ncbi:hypothetical protein [Pseudoxanthomonas sp. PXM02]|uniref:hypothetical protein n=1 Tax=Pseudoxanthomonas sp. PXM02 TaxID=2769294 RepID=UPI00177E97B6|nr:hypothetical protein [Pseudoxanthomonas sp. PXM02]MBD9480341.1 hypothetical protein [Pseudoxanthomonas sp. PXM02]
MRDFLQNLFVSATDFCVPGPDCHPDWTAWGALITFLAVLVPAMQHERDRRDQRKEKVRKGHAAVRKFAYDAFDLGGQIESHLKFLPHMVQMLTEVGPSYVSDVLRLRATIPTFDPIKEFDQISLAFNNLGIAVRSFNQVIELGSEVHMDAPENHIFAKTDLLAKLLAEVEAARANAMHAMETTVPGSTKNIRRVR